MLIIIGDQAEFSDWFGLDLVEGLIEIVHHLVEFFGSAASGSQFLNDIDWMFGGLLLRLLSLASPIHVEAKDDSTDD